jgi:hypothetical protein
MGPQGINKHASDTCAPGMASIAWPRDVTATLPPRIGHYRGMNAHRQPLALLLALSGCASGAASSGATPPPSPAAVAGDLDGAYLEPKCTDEQENGFCHHSGVMEQRVKFGGDAGKQYDVTLNVWSIAEGIVYEGGQPHGQHFYVGGKGITPRYSPCALKVGGQDYFLNRKDDRANDQVYKFEYTTPPIRIPGQADLLLYCVDDAKKHISINNPPPLGKPENGAHVIAAPPPRLAARLGQQPFANTFIYLEVASAIAAN